MLKVKLSLIVLVLITAISSCDKMTGDDDSIVGGWNCREETSNNDYHQYSIFIDRAGNGYDTTYYVIYNFNNLGQEVETYVQLANSKLTIRFMSEGYSVSGNGYVSKDLKTIDWTYMVSGEPYSALYSRH